MTGPDPAAGCLPLQGVLDAECGRVVDRLLNAGHGAGLPALTWRAVTDPDGWVQSVIGQVTADTDRQARAELLAWATRHRLVPAADPVTGTNEMHGRIGGLPVQIWAVIDRATFEHAITPATGGTP